MEELDFRELLVMIFRKKISIIVIIAIFVIAGCIYTFNYTTPMYSSNARIVLGKVSTMDGEFLDRNITISESDLTLNSSLILTYSELAKSRSIMEEVKERLDYNISVDELLSSVSVSRINTSDLLQVTAINADSKIARDIVNEVVDVFSEHIKEIYKIDNVYIIDKPIVANAPYNIHHEKDIIKFTLIGICTACAYMILCIFIDNTIKNSNEIENLLKVRTLISIPVDKKKQGELITVNDGKSIIAEAFKTLRTNVQFSSVDSKGSQVLLVTSCMPSEGKSYVSANLAIAFAQTGKRVIIVDSDMRRGRQSVVFNVPNKNGLSNYISNIDSNGYEINWSLSEYIKKTHISNLDIITAGSVPPNPAELLASSRLVELIEDLKKYYDMIIFDGAPILPITDSLLLGRTIGKVMLVAVYNKTKKDNLVKAKESIEDVGGKVIGIVLNKVSIDSGSYGDGYYYYGKAEKGLTFKEKVIKSMNDKLEIVRTFFANRLKKVKSLGKRLSPAKATKEMSEIERLIKAEEKAKEKAIKEEQAKKAAEEKAKKEAELAKLREAERIRKEGQAKKIAEEKAKEKAIKEEQAKKAAEEKAKKEAELAKLREAERIRKEEQAKKLVEEKAKEKAIKEEQAKKAAEEKAKKEAELAKLREAERIKKEEQAKKAAEEKAKEDAIMAEEMLKMQKEEAKRKQEELLRKAEVKKKNEELKAKKKQERAKKFNDFKSEMSNKREEISEVLKIKRAEYSNRYNDYKIRKQEEKILAAEEKVKREAELAKVREEERIKREEERKKATEERAKRLAELEAEKAERLARQAEEKAKREEELAKIREAEKIKKEEERRIAAEAKAKQIAILAEEKAKREAEAKYTDEYLQENLYPKTKYNKF